MSEQREIGTELVRRVTHLNEVLEENERLREAIRRLADQDATLSVQGGNVTVTMDATLTDAEREAVDRQAKWLVNQAKGKSDIHSADLLLQEAATLRGLLDRIGGGA